MATLRTITSANSVFSLMVMGLFPTPVKIQGYSADAAFAVDAIPTAEAHMGVDGKMSAGYVFSPKKMKVKLQADSDSTTVFDQWNNAQQAQREIYFANAVIDIPSLGKSYSLTKGVLTNFKPMPDAKKTLDAVEFEITWESITQNLIN